MTLSRFDYHQIKPGNRNVLKGFLLALCIHGGLFFVGGMLFVKPVQYSVKSADGSIEVDLVTALSQSDVDTAKPITSITEKQQAAAKVVLQKELVTQLQPDVAKPITSTTEEQREAVKIVPQEEQKTRPQSDVDVAKSIKPTMKKQEATVKTMLRPSQGTIRTKSKPDYFRNRPPRYPPLAKKMHQEGLVMLIVEVDRKGMPVKVEVEQSSGYQLLDQAALKAVRHWRFQPERIGDIPMKSKVSIPIRFRLQE